MRCHHGMTGGVRAECFLHYSEIDPLHLEQLLNCFTSAFLGLVGMSLQPRLVEILERRHDRKPADEFRDQAVKTLRPVKGATRSDRGAARSTVTLSAVPNVVGS